MSRPRSTAAVATIAVAMILSACSGATASSAPPASAAPTASDGVTVINATLTDALRIELDTATVKAGTPVRFVVTNAGQSQHDFFLGDEKAQMDHESAMGGMDMGDDASGLSLEPGATKTLDYTFETAGMYLAGCHVPGHYAGGMKTSITVTD